MLSVQAHCPEPAAKALATLLVARRGRVLADRPRPGASLVEVLGELPASEVEVLNASLDGTPAAGTVLHCAFARWQVSAPCLGLALRRRCPLSKKAPASNHLAAAGVPNRALLGNFPASLVVTGHPLIRWWSRIHLQRGRCATT